MEFTVYRASESKIKPHLSLKSHKDKGFWTIEINTLDSLLKFIAELPNEVILYEDANIELQD